MFRRGAYLAEHTLQAASVEFVPHRGTNYARGADCKNLSESPKGVFDSLSSPQPISGWGLLFGEGDKKSDFLIDPGHGSDH